MEACYAISKVVNSESSFLPGGLVGNDSGSILSSYWGLETASSTVGVGYGLSTGSATGLIAMAVPSGFEGWNFADAWMLGGADTVPKLRGAGRALIGSLRTGDVFCQKPLVLRSDPFNGPPTRRSGRRSPPWGAPRSLLRAG